MEVSGQLHTLGALPLRKEPPENPKAGLYILQNRKILGPDKH
jgi:hypothetical protein